MRECERLGGRPGLADDLDTVLALQELGDASADDLVVVEQEHGDGLSGDGVGAERGKVGGAPQMQYAAGPAPADQALAHHHAVGEVVAGVGEAALRVAEVRVAGVDAAVVAEVQADNHRALRLFQGFGFRQRAWDGGVRELVRDLGDERRPSQDDPQAA